MLLGEYEHTIDDKNRLTLPARFREQLAGGVVVTRGMDGCLYAYPRDDWSELEARVAELDPLTREARTIQRHFFSGASEAELDRQGRLLVPPSLREYAALGGEAMVVGSRDHIELWEPTRWADYSAAMTSPDVLAQHLQGLGI